MDGKVPYVTLIDNCVTGVFAKGSFYTFPAGRVCGCKVDHRTHIPVYAAGFCIDVDGLVVLFMIIFKGIGVKTAVKVTQYLNIPHALVQPFHRQGLHTAPALRVKIKIKIDSRRQRRPGFKHRLIALYYGAQVVAVVKKFLIYPCIVYFIQRLNLSFLIDQYFSSMLYSHAHGFSLEQFCFKAFTCIFQKVGADIDLIFFKQQNDS